jgi:hypothetical protein
MARADVSDALPGAILEPEIRRKDIHLKELP